MEQNLSIARTLLPQIKADTSKHLLDRPEFLLGQTDNIKICYAPFDHVAVKAKLVVVGITPGMTQAINALNAAFLAKENGATLEGTLQAAKLTGSFSGPIRNNLIAMLDHIGVAQHFGIVSTSEMFAPGSTDIHFTSALRYPTFVDGKNYNGTPAMLKTPLLRQMVETQLAEEADLLPSALWLPLGPKAEEAAKHLVTMHRLKSDHILSGMPHPSGANAERVAVFLGRKAPALASRQTNAEKLLSAASKLKTQIARLEGVAA